MSEQCRDTSFLWISRLQMGELMLFHGLRWPPLGAAPSLKVTMSGIKSSAVFKGNARKWLINLKKCVTRKGYLCRMTKMNKLSL